jgi:hypothetical protein
VFLAGIDPDLDSVAALERRKHIEPYLTSMVDTVNTKSRPSPWPTGPGGCSR